MIEWDEAKRASSLVKHGLDFADVAEFNFRTALVEVDDREDYGEIRETAIGWWRAQICVIVFVERDDDIRVISFRKANESEVNRYVES